MELLKNNKVVDTIKVGRYDVLAMKKLLAELGIKRDEEETWEKKKARLEMEKAFKTKQKKEEADKAEL